MARMRGPACRVTVPAGVEVGGEETRILTMAGRPDGTARRARERKVVVGSGAMVTVTGEEVVGALEESPG